MAGSFNSIVDESTYVCATHRRPSLPFDRTDPCKTIYNRRPDQQMLQATRSAMLQVALMVSRITIISGRHQLPIWRWACNLCGRDGGPGV